jgi:hypothetical protein
MGNISGRRQRAEGEYAKWNLFRYWLSLRAGNR